MSSNPSDPATDEVAFSARTPGPSRRRVALVAGGALALAVGAVATSMAASPAPPGDTATNGVMPAPFIATDPTLDEETLDLDHGRLRGHDLRQITVRTISGSTVTLETDDGWTRTIAVTDAVELTKGGQDIELTDLAVGDQVRLRQTRNDDGTYTVNALAVVVPSARGEVSDVSASGFKLTTRDGSIWTIAVDQHTDYLYGAGEGSLADVTNGATAIVKGTSTGDNALTALTVRVRPDRAIGKVTAKSSDSITVTKRDGSTVTIHVDSDTIYRVAGVEDADLGDVAVDMGIGVTGRERADGSIDADTVAAGSGRGLRWGREGRDRDGFDGPRADPGRLDLPGPDEDLSAG